MNPNIAIVSGEMSGDAVGALLAGEIKRLAPNVELWGLGSSRMAEAGVSLLCDSAAWSAIGVMEALKVYPALKFKHYPHLLREIERRHPAIVVAIDFGALNVALVRWCKARSIRTFYYFPPASWRRSGPISSELARIANGIATPFSWSAERLAATGANVRFVGHPLLEIAQSACTRVRLCDELGMDPGKPVVALLPGSRGFEIRYNTPVMLEAAMRLRADIPEVQFILSAAPNADRELLSSMVRDADKLHQQVSTLHSPRGEPHRGEPARIAKQLVTPEGILVPADKLRDAGPFRPSQARFDEGPLPIVIVEGRTTDVLAHANAALVCSGSATLEAAVHGTPMVVIYCGSKLMNLEYRLRRLNKLPFIAMPNIVAQRQVVEEFVQDAADPVVLANRLSALLRDPAVRGDMKAGLAAVRADLGSPGASRRTAEFVLETASISAAPSDSDG